MSDAHGSENDERKKYLEELVNSYSRKELNEIAEALDLNLNEYKKKKEIAEAILKVRERKENLAAIVTYKPALGKEVRKVEEMFENTVKGKRKAIMEKASEFKIFGSVELRNSTDVFHNAVQAFKRNTIDQAIKNQEIARDEFTQSIGRFQENIKEFGQSIRTQIRKNQDFVKSFYG